MIASRGQWIPGVIFAALMAWICCLPLFTMEGNWYENHEHERYLNVAHHFREAFQAGYLYPRWLPNLYGGFGYPTFIYYQPGFFFTFLPFSFLFAYPFQAMYWTIWFLFFLGGCGAFLLARSLSGSIWFGLFGTFLFLVTPYAECNVYVRGDLSEYTAMMFTPWPLFFLWQIKENMRRSNWPGVFSFVGLSFSLAAIFFSHPAIALFYLGIFPVLVLAHREIGFPNRPFYLFVGIGLVSALVLSSPYWLTFWRMKGLVDLSRVLTVYQPIEHLINLKPLFNSEWRYGSSPFGMPLHLGLPHFLLAVTGGIVGRRVPFVRVSLFVYLGLVLMMTYAGYPLWKFLPLLAYVQFPWRLLAIIAVLQVICACGLAHARVFRSGVVGFGLLLVLATGVVLSARNQFQFEKIYEIEREQITTSSVPPFRDYESFNSTDFLPRTVKERPARMRQDEAMVHPQEGSEVDLQALPGHSPYHIKVGFRTGAEPAVVVIDQFGFPGMKVILTGGSTPATVMVPDLLVDGRMAVTLPADSQGTLEGYYDGPPGWRIHWAAILLWFLGLSGAGLFQYRRRTANPDLRQSG